MISQTGISWLNAKRLVSFAAIGVLGVSFAQAQTVIIDGTAPDYVLNGSFETATDWWIGPSDGGTATTLSGDLGLVRGLLRRTNPGIPSDGSNYAVVGADNSSGSQSNQRGFYVNTGYVLNEGDTFNFSFWHGAHFPTAQGYEGAQFEWQLFTTTTNSADGTIDGVVASGIVDAINDFNLTEQSYSSIGSVSAGMDGKTLFVAFVPASNMIGKFVALDEVNLTTIPEASTYALFLGAFSLALIAKRRKRQCAD
ncbi:hypothetical protein [Cerasicoccus fimbriatus]|uniref:hypothetical protein n=1 Tax=Cerasicoccus fimbriatus TaxID=3014554 RepID=UPI0022B346BC|nr:hypothetical protein [Cerasicoccus sp. TK19100]